jgi:glycosyltransferase involved in cell wall biosynthesis
MRIGIDANLLLIDRPRGIEVYLAELTTRMPRFGKGHEFRLYFNYVRSRHRATVERFVRGGVEVRFSRIPWQILWPLYWHLGLPVDWLIGAVDVMFYPACVALPQRRGRMVVTVHDLLPLTHPTFYTPDLVRKFQTRVAPSVTRADAVIVVSTYTGTLVQERFGLPSERIHRIPNGVHERFHSPKDPEAAAAVATRYGIQGPYLLFVGAMELNKNLARLVEAFAQAACSTARDHALVLAGKSSLGETALQATVARLGLSRRVLLLGYVPAADLPALYGAATAFLFPSLAEGFGIPPLEAMACGCPVLTSATPALCEVVGDAALTVDPCDVEAIAEGIQRLVEDDDLRETLRSRGLRRASAFSWDRTAAETLAVLEAVSTAY